MPQLTEVWTVIVHPELIPEGQVGPLLERLADFAPVLERWGEIMSEAQKVGFAEEGQPFGDPWAELSPWTLMEKARRGYPEKPLVRTGKLEAAVGQAVLVSASGVETGVDLAEVPYARFHQSGTRRMPARVIVALTASEVEEMEQVLRAFIAEATGEAMEGIEIRRG